VDACGVDECSILGGFQAMSCRRKFKVLDELETPPERSHIFLCYQAVLGPIP